MERDDEWKDELKDFSSGESGKRIIPAPEGYFDQLPDTVLQRWQKEKQLPVTKQIGLRKMIASAAIVTGLAIGITMLNKQSVEVSSSAEISTVDAYEYIPGRRGDEKTIQPQHQHANQSSCHWSHPKPTDHVLIWPCTEDSIVSSAFTECC